MIGAGLIGRAWAMVFRALRLDGRAHDSDPAQLAERARYIGPSLAEQQARALRRCCDAQARIAYVSALDDAVTGARGCTSICRATRAEARRCSRNWIGSRTRRHSRELDLGDSGVAIYRKLAGRCACLVAHPVNPPHLVPVVELCWRAVDGAADDRARARSDERCRTGADPRATRDRRLHPESACRVRC
jgi:hypothetical protein